MNRDQALAKIKKCMALGRSANPHEAAAAMRQAQKLMAEHGLSDTDVELSDVSETTCAAALNAPDWEVFLANVVAQAFGCDVLWTATRKWIGHKPRRQMAVLFIGVGSHPEIAGYAWQVLDRQCARQRLDHIRQQPTQDRRTDRRRAGRAAGHQALTAARIRLGRRHHGRR